jgi:S-adenosylmethionine:tRNA ribosyltransferase-isomerase
VIAVGTTVVRALESAVVAGAVPAPGLSRELPQGNPQGIQPAEGWTGLVVTPERGLYAVDGLLTGLHEPHSSHLAMLEAFADRSLLQEAYAAALQQGYLWHEFGDLHLLLP